MASGFVVVMGPCCNCSRVFTFNPNHVPSVRVRGEREPVCRACIESANPERIKRGLEPFVVHPEAYEPEPEENC